MAGWGRSLPPRTGMPPDRRATIRRYLAASAMGHIVWEVAQLPLYTLWYTAPAGSIAFAVLHCTLGDLIMAWVALMVSLATLGTPDWPRRRYGAVVGGVIVLTVAATIVIEHLNTVVYPNWAYTPAMPRLPWIGTGLSPVMQWVIVPIVATAWAARLRRTQHNERTISCTK